MYEYVLVCQLTSVLVRKSVFMPVCVKHVGVRTSADICFCVCNLCVHPCLSLCVRLHECTGTNLSCKGDFLLLVPCFVFSQEEKSHCVWVLVAVASSCRRCLNVSKEDGARGEAAVQKRLPTIHQSFTGLYSVRLRLNLAGAHKIAQCLKFSHGDHFQIKCPTSRGTSQLLPQYVIVSWLTFCEQCHDSQSK